MQLHSTARLTYWAGLPRQNGPRSPQPAPGRWAIPMIF